MKEIVRCFERRLCQQPARICGFVLHVVSVLIFWQCKELNREFTHAVDVNVSREQQFAFVEALWLLLLGVKIAGTDDQRNSC